MTTEFHWLKYCFLCVLMLFKMNGNAQNNYSTQIDSIKNLLRQNNNGSQKAALLLEIGNLYINKPHVTAADVDSAYTYQSNGGRAALEFKNDEQIAVSYLLAGEINRKKGDREKALSMMNQALQIFSKYGLEKHLAEAYEQIGRTYGYNPNDEEESSSIGVRDLNNRIAYYEKAIDLFRTLGNKDEENKVVRPLSKAYSDRGEHKKGIAILEQAINSRGSEKDEIAAKLYGDLGLRYMEDNNVVQGLKNEITAYKIAEQLTNNYAIKADVLLKMSDMYTFEGFFDSAYSYTQSALSLAKQVGDTDKIEDAYANMALILPNLKKEKEVLPVLNELEQYPINNIHTKIWIQTSYANTYMNLLDYAKASPHMDKMLALYKSSDSTVQNTSTMYFTALRYYSGTHQYAIAHKFLQERQLFLEKMNDTFGIADNELFWFEIDSSQGNYISAIRHLEKNASLMKLLADVQKAQQFNELQVQYYTEKKDGKIQMLTTRNKLQTIQIQKEQTVRNSVIVCSAFLLLLLALGYNRYRLRQRTNVKLQRQQAEINAQNELQKKLLNEKEWLLKEIHHRVKNNLQIVISLLNTQSAYLDNEDAVAAIRISQNRMHAMSLIHQKLYQSDNMANIDMFWYVHELANHMMESFDVRNRIEFLIDVDKIYLNIVQAVPLGLILNEAISNSIKYAFPQKDKGIITVSLKKDDESMCTLNISDNGIGLPDGFDPEATNSLGMSLMIGLSNQIDGDFKILNNHGVTININFTIKNDLLGVNE